MVGWIKRSKSTFILTILTYVYFWWIRPKGLNPPYTIFSKSAIKTLINPSTIFSSKVYGGIYGRENGKYYALYMWWAEPESNRRHRDFQSRALPTELSALNFIKKRQFVNCTYSAKTFSDALFINLILSRSNCSFNSSALSNRVSSLNL